MLNKTIDAVVLANEGDRVLVARNVDEETYRSLDFSTENWYKSDLDLCLYHYYNLGKFSVGDRIRIITNGIEMRSFPPQANAIRITKVKEAVGEE